MMDATAMLGSSTLDGSIECGQRQFCIDITAYGVANNASTTGINNCGQIRKPEG